MYVRRSRLVVPVALLALLGLVAALNHQTESRRLRSEQFEIVAKLRTNLTEALDCASALQDSAGTVPSTSRSGDTLIFYLPAQETDRKVKQIRLYVDQSRGGLWKRCGDGPPEAVAASVDGLSASIENLASGGATVWIELRGRLTLTGDLPIRKHVFRSIPIRSGDVRG